MSWYIYLIRYNNLILEEVSLSFLILLSHPHFKNKNTNLRDIFFPGKHIPMTPHGKNYMLITLNYNQFICTRIDIVLYTAHNSASFSYSSPANPHCCSIQGCHCTAGLKLILIFLSLTLHPLIFLILFQIPFFVLIFFLV